jgi:trigger factor
MDVKELAADGLSRSYEVTIAASDLQARIDARLLEVGKEVQLKGFRPGKVPLPMLRRQFGKAVLSDVLDKAIKTTSQEAIKDHADKLAGQPAIEITQYEPGGALSYTIGVDLAPEIEPADFSGIELERSVAPVNDEDVVVLARKMVQSLRGPQPVEDAVVADDIVTVDYEVEIDGTVDDRLKIIDAELHAGQAIFDDFGGTLIGKSVGEAGQAPALLPDDFGLPEFAGKSGTVRFTVKQVARFDEVTLNEDTAARHGYESVDDLTEFVKNTVTSKRDQMSRTRLKRLLFDHLDAIHDIDCPPRMVKQEYQNVLHQMGVAASDQYAEQPEGAPPAKIDDSSLSDDQKAEYQRIARRRVRLGLLLAEIGRRAEISVNVEELNRAIYQQAMSHPQQAREIVAFYKKNPDAVDRLRAPIYEDKVVDFILAQATVIDNTVTVDELRALLEDEDENI